jgi:hypothetical protein
MEKIKIISDVLNAEELYSLLKPEVKTNEELNLEIEKQPEGTLAIDPSILIATMVFTQTTLTALIAGIFSLIQKRQERETAKQIAGIEVKIEKEAITLKAPVGATKEEIRAVVDEALEAQKKGKKIKHIAILKKHK